MKRVGILGIVMDVMDRVKDKVRDMVEIVMEDEIITDNEMIDTINRIKVEMGMLHLHLKLQVVHGTHHQDLELH